MHEMRYITICYLVSLTPLFFRSSHRRRWTMQYAPNIFEQWVNLTSFSKWPSHWAQTESARSIRVVLYDPFKSIFPVLAHPGGDLPYCCSAALRTCLSFMSSSSSWHSFCLFCFQLFLYPWQIFQCLTHTSEHSWKTFLARKQS